jgi:hypothetical protein
MPKRLRERNLKGQFQKKAKFSLQKIEVESNEQILAQPVQIHSKVSVFYFLGIISRGNFTFCKLLVMSIILAKVTVGPSLISATPD